jgi:hypothetical protein
LYAVTNSNAGKQLFLDPEENVTRMTTVTTLTHVWTASVKTLVMRLTHAPQHRYANHSCIDHTAFVLLVLLGIMAILLLAAIQVARAWHINPTFIFF